MYKVMLVDDEQLIINGIKHLMEWDKLGLEVVAMANNGEEALGKCVTEAIDIIITDINMPKVTGLEMIEKLRLNGTHIKFIILSGHDEFSYAKEAITLGVEGYILKPIDEEELERILQETVEKLNKTKVSQKNSLDKNSEINKFLKGKISTGIDHIFSNLQKEAQCYSIATLILKEQQEQQKVSEMLKEIEEVHKRMCLGIHQMEVCYDIKGMIILINSWETHAPEVIKKYYHKMQEAIKVQMMIESFLVCGELSETMEALPQLYKKLKKYEKYSLMNGYGTAIDVTQLPTYKQNNITIDTDKLYKYMIEGNHVKVEDVVVQLFEDVQQEYTTPENMYQIGLKLIMLLQQLVSDFKLERKQGIKGTTELLNELYSAESITFLKNIFLEEIREVSDLINEKEKRYTPVVQQVINYIHDNYWEDMNLKTLAYEYNMNTSYLGQIFLKEVGYSFSQYLNNIKNSKAKEMILTTNMKIVDIAKAVGYADTSYFYRKFKKHYGVSPATLREIKKY